MKVDGEGFPVNPGIPFLKPKHSKNDLRARETNDHKFYHVSERSRGERDDRGPTNSSLGVWSSIYIVGCDRRGYP